jgi:hypothetical protein
MNSNQANNMYMCCICKKTFKSQQALSVHIAKSPYCMVESNNSYMFKQNNNTYSSSIQINMDVAVKPTSNTDKKEISSHELSNSINLPENNFDNVEENNNTTSNNMAPEFENNDSGSNCKEQELNCFQNSLQHEVKLLKLLNNLGTPLYAYNEIMNWAQEANMAQFDFDTKHKNYHWVIQNMEDQLGMQSFRPEKISVSLKGNNKEMDVVVYNVPTLLASLFNDTELNQYKNLVVNKNNRYGKYTPNNKRLGEVNSGHWYNTAYNNLVKDSNKDFLCPLILASDKTTLSEMGDLHVNRNAMCICQVRHFVIQSEVCSGSVYEDICVYYYTKSIYML